MLLFEKEENNAINIYIECMTVAMNVFFYIFFIDILCILLKGIM